MSIIGYKKLFFGHLYDDDGGWLGYKEAIAILEIPKYNNLNNMNRSDIIDPFCAKYRCERAYVLKIFDIKTGKQVKEAASFWNTSFIYREGEWVETYFNPDIDETCESGIHYYLNIECAKYFNWTFRHMIFNDKEKRWHDNGQLACCFTYKNGKLNGLF